MQYNLNTPTHKIYYVNIPKYVPIYKGGTKIIIYHALFILVQ